MTSLRATNTIANAIKYVISAIGIYTPFRKGVETAATVPLQVYYSKCSANMQDKVELCNKKTAENSAADD